MYVIGSFHNRTAVHHNQRKINEQSFADGDVTHSRFLLLSLQVCSLVTYWNLERNGASNVQVVFARAEIQKLTHRILDIGEGHKKSGSRSTCARRKKNYEIP